MSISRIQESWADARRWINADQRMRRWPIIETTSHEAEWQIIEPAISNSTWIKPQNQFGLRASHLGTSRQY